MNEQQKPQRRKSDNRRFNWKGLLLAVGTAAASSAAISLHESPSFNREEGLRLAVQTAVAALAFLTPRRVEPEEPQRIAPASLPPAARPPSPEPFGERASSPTPRGYTGEDDCGE